MSESRLIANIQREYAANGAPISEAEAKRTWAAVKAALINSIDEEEDNRLTLRGFGSFKVTKVSAYQTVLPSNPMITVTVKPHNRVSFNPGHLLEEKLNANEVLENETVSELDSLPTIPGLPAEMGGLGA